MRSTEERSNIYTELLLKCDFDISKLPVTFSAFHPQVTGNSYRNITLPHIGTIDAF